MPAICGPNREKWINFVASSWDGRMAKLRRDAGWFFLFFGGIVGWGLFSPGSTYHRDPQWIISVLIKQLIIHHFLSDFVGFIGFFLKNQAIWLIKNFRAHFGLNQNFSGYGNGANRYPFVYCSLHFFESSRWLNFELTEKSHFWAILPNLGQTKIFPKNPFLAVFTWLTFVAK